MRSPQDGAHGVDVLGADEHHDVIPLAEFAATAADLRLAIANDGTDQALLGQREITDEGAVGSAALGHLEFDHLEVRGEEGGHLGDVASDEPKDPVGAGRAR